MIEYLYDAIRAVAGQEINVAAVITDDAGAVITEGCKFALHIGDEMFAFDGIYIPATQNWQFTIPAEITKGLSGRYYYCIQKDGSNLCFKTPFYLV
jgi:oligoribonuclease (3'-5' exoribonuclease)